jgi:prophage tail gpP-like protein
MSAAIGTAPTGAPIGSTDTVSLLVGGNDISGWQRVSISRSLDSVPSSFDIQVTEKYPYKADVVLQAGSTCQVKIGDDLVITGYVDRYSTSIAAMEHTVRIQGRSMSEDLVDCAALTEISATPGGQIMGGTALGIAQQLAKPYGVTVNSTADDYGVPIPQFNINLGETVWEIVDRVTRRAQLLAYDMPDGSVVLAKAGTETMASGFSIGGNIESAVVTFSMDQRYSDYEGHFLSTMVYGNDYGPGGAPVIHDAEAQALKRADGSPRFRKRYVITEQTDLGQSLAQARAQWECNRRQGRSNSIQLICDSWRDSAGALWAPNHLAPIAADVLKLRTDTWLIAEVTYTRDENGQHAAITMMDPLAFSPEPVSLQTLAPTVQQIEDANNPTKPSPDNQAPKPELAIRPQAILQ